MTADTIARFPKHRTSLDELPMVWCIKADAVSPIRRDRRRWCWTVQTDGDDAADRHGTVTVPYRTDSRGDGLWLDTGRGTRDRQLLGHAQWSLAGVASSARRRRVLKAMAGRHGWQEPA